MSRRFLIAAGLAALLAPAVSAHRPISQRELVPPKEKGDVEPAPAVATLIVFGNDPCPRSSTDEIVVCARLPETGCYQQFLHQAYQDRQQAKAEKAQSDVP